MNLDAEQNMLTDAMPTGAMLPDVVQPAEVQTDAEQPDVKPISVEQQSKAKKPKAKKTGTIMDPVVDLNNWLQHSPKGNVASDLSWVFAQKGPNNQAIHHAIAKWRGVILGEGEGVSKCDARTEAAKVALGYLGENGLPSLAEN